MKRLIALVVFMVISFSFSPNLSAQPPDYWFEYNDHYYIYDASYFLMLPGALDMDIVGRYSNLTTLSDSEFAEALDGQDYLQMHSLVVGAVDDTGQSVASHALGSAFELKSNVPEDVLADISSTGVHCTTTWYFRSNVGTRNVEFKIEGSSLCTEHIGYCRYSVSVYVNDSLVETVVRGSGTEDSIPPDVKVISIQANDGTKLTVRSNVYIDGTESIAGRTGVLVQNGLADVEVHISSP